MDVKKLDIIRSDKPQYASWLCEAYDYAKKSRHPSTHNAALLVRNGRIILSGVNNFPPGVKHRKERIKALNKHNYLNHAERDVIFKAAKSGISTKGAVMIMPWLPCIACANAIITSGIKKLIVHRQMVERTKKKWVPELKNAVKIMKEAKVKVIAYDGTIGAKAYMHKKHWNA